MEPEWTYKWIQDRLREMQSGQLTAQDKAQLEAIALHDPFVADAIEGYTAHPDAMHEAYLAALEEKIRHRPRVRRRWLIPNLTVTAIAASVILIIATYAVVSRMDPQEEKQLTVWLSPDSLQTRDTTRHDEVVWNENEGTREDAIPPSSDTTAEPVAAGPTSTSEIRPSGASRSRAKSGESQPFPGEEVALSEPTLAGTSAPSGVSLPDPNQASKELSEVETEDGVVMEVPATMDDQSIQKDLAAKRDEGYYANQMDPALMKRRAFGRIVDATSGESLPFARLSTSYTNETFYTDVEGYFELDLPERDATIRLHYTGYVDSLLILHQGDESVSLFLRPIPEIPPLMIPTKTIAGAAETASSGSQNAIDFAQFIVNASAFPLTDSRQHAGRVVTITFEVYRQGKPQRLKVLLSSGDPAYDDEARRLIESGPTWSCPDQEYPCQRSYTFCFK